MRYKVISQVLNTNAICDNKNCFIKNKKEIIYYGCIFTFSRIMMDNNFIPCNLDNVFEGIGKMIHRFTPDQ